MFVSQATQPREANKRTVGRWESFADTFAPRKRPPHRRFHWPVSGLTSWERIPGPNRLPTNIRSGCEPLVGSQDWALTRSPLRGQRRIDQLIESTHRLPVIPISGSETPDERARVSRLPVLTIRAKMRFPHGQLE